MRSRDVIVTSVAALFLTPVFLITLSTSSAQVMQSTNYRIEADSINVGGGLSESTNYTLESTVGEVGTGNSGSTNYGMRAGYQQMVGSSFISMSAPTAVTMTPSLQGITGGTANGSTSVLVTTDSQAGYTLTISASESPALRKGGDTIADYVPVGGNPDYTFITDSTDAQFGYSPYGDDVVVRFQNDGNVCNTESGSTALSCWDGLALSEELIAEGGGPNTPLGATTTVYFRVGIGSSVFQASGVYTATTTLTALAL